VHACAHTYTHTQINPLLEKFATDKVISGVLSLASVGLDPDN